MSQGGKDRLIITGKNINVSDKTEEYVRRKIGRLERHLSEPVEVRVELATEDTKNTNQRQNRSGHIAQERADHPQKSAPPRCKRRWMPW